MFIDADTHVDECDETWRYMPEDLRPTTLSLEKDQIPPWLATNSASNHARFWFMDGQLHSRKVRSDEATGTVTATRELSDVPGRVRDMDDMGVELQVLYPTVLLNELTRRQDLDVALCRSYNRWLAERCGASQGRIAWVAMPPLSSMPDALEELEFAKANGAVGVFKRGIEWDRPVHDPYFFPLYSKAADLDLAVCIHATLPWTALDPHFSRLDNPYPQGTNGITVLQAFQGLVSRKIPERFPSLRFGFIESGSSWLPYLLELTRQPKVEESLTSRRFFVTCEPSEDIAYLVSLFGTSSLIIGTDYGHSDRAAVRDKHKEIASAGILDADGAERLTRENARQFYGL